jgi:hypothetical protein
LDRGENLDEAGEQRLLGELFKALVEQKCIREIAGGFWIGGRKQIADELGVIA